MRDHCPVSPHYLMPTISDALPNKRLMLSAPALIAGVLAFRL
jgi:hypothetical protein